MLKNNSADSAAIIAALRSRVQALEQKIEAMHASVARALPEDLILGSVQDAVIVLDRKRTVQFWNRAAEALYGWSAAEITGSILELVLQTRYPAGTDANALYALLEQSGSWTGQVIQRHRDGHDLMIESSVRFVRDAAGQIAGVVGVNRDVTARVRAETARRVSEATGALLAATRDEEAMLNELAHLVVPALGDWCAIHLLMPDQTLRPVVVHHSDPARVAAIAAFRQSYGFNQKVAFGIAQVLRTGEAELIPEITPARLAAVLPDAPQQQLMQSLGLRAAICVPLKTQEAVFGVITLVTAESGRRYGAADLQIACDMAERAASAIAHTRMTQAIKTAAERTDATLAVLDTLLTSATIGIAFLDRDLNFTHMNATLATIIGHAADAYRSQSFRTLLPDYANILEARLYDVLTIGKPLVDIEVLVTPGGTMRPGTYEINYYPVCGAGAQITGVGVVVLDITERERLRAQLTQSQKLEGLGRLAGGIAHDFNNLLTAILGNAELACDSLPPDAPEQEDLKLIASTATRAAGLTRQLLTFARKQPLAPTVLTLTDLVTQVTALLQRLIGEDIVLSTQLAPDLWPIRADPVQIEQVIVNLAVNARDAMPEGGNLTIETANVELDAEYAHTHLNVVPGSYVRIAVTDTGVGMPPEVQAHIFEPFFTTKAVGKGTGLGLALSYSIVQQHGGTIWMYSEVGRGSTFMIYLPRVYTAAERLDQAEVVAELPQGSETVLLVEDEQIVRALTARILRAQGFRVLEATDGEHALAIIASYLGHLDLVLTDVVMPIMSGPELVSRLHERFPHLAALYMSGYTEHTMIQRGEIESTVALLHKPFTRTTLLEKVRYVLDQRPAVG